MRQTKQSYLVSCKKTLEDAKRLVDYLFNGMLIEFVPSQHEYGCYIDLIQRIQAASTDLANVCNGLGELCLEVSKDEQGA